MKDMTAEEIQKDILRIIEMVQSGEDVLVTSGRTNEKIAVIIPYAKYRQQRKRKLGLLKGKANFRIREDFKLTDREFLDA